MDAGNICVIGAGKWGKNHIQTLYDLGHLGGIVDQNKQLLNDYEMEYPNISIYQNVEDALMNNDFIGFIIATPAETHYEIAKEIIVLNKHVLIEKPLALTVKESEDLVNLSEQHKINLMVGHLLLFHPAIIKIKELISSGEIGKLQYIYSNRLNLGKVRTEENVFWSLAPHDISIFQYFTESYPIHISASGSTFLQKGINDSTITQLKYSGGIEGHIFVSWLHPFKEHRLVVIGSEAMITFEDSVEGKPLKFYSKKYEMENGIPEKIDGPVKLINYNQKMPLKEELSYFINHLGGDKPKIANGHHALEVIKILSKASNQLKFED